MTDAQRTQKTTFIYSKYAKVSMQMFLIICEVVSLQSQNTKYIPDNNSFILLAGFKNLPNLEKLPPF